MNLTQLARVSVLCLLVFLTALTAFAQPNPQPCSCEYCARGNANRSCVLDGQTTTCGVFLSFTTCGTGLAASSANSVDAAFLALMSVQEPATCAIVAN